MAWFEQAAPLFEQLLDTRHENEAMWTPGMQFELVPMVTAAVAVTVALPAEAAPGYAVGQCVNAKASFPAAILPIAMAGGYLFDYQGTEQRFKDFGFRGGKITLLKRPKHG